MQALAPITIYMDDQGAMLITSNLVTNRRSKYIDMRYHMIRDDIADGLLKLEFVSTNLNITNIMTTALEKVKPSIFTKLLLQNVE